MRQENIDQPDGSFNELAFLQAARLMEKIAMTHAPEINAERQMLALILREVMIELSGCESNLSRYNLARSIALYGIRAMRSKAYAIPQISGLKDLHKGVFNSDQDGRVDCN